MSLKPPAAPKFQDVFLEGVRREHADKIVELQKLPAAELKVISDVSLVDATDKPVPHGLGRNPKCVLVSPPRGASSTGRIEEVRSSSYDRTKVVVLKATNWGATVLVDLVVL